MALSLNYDFAVWATSGLETSFFTLLLTASFYIYFFSGQSLPKKLIFSGMILALACMTRPDGIIFFIYLNIFLFVWNFLTKINIKEIAFNLLCFNASFAVILLPYLIWKINYYGDIFPNTYYVKSAGESYLNQGLYYIWIFFDSYKSTLAAILPVIILIKLLIGKKSLYDKFRLISDNNILSSMLFSFGAALCYLFIFVARVGGDFMFARFLIPVLPFLYFSIESGISYLFKDSKKSIIMIFSFLLIIIYSEKSFRDDLFIENISGKLSRKKNETTRGITDERFYYYSYWEQFPKSENLQEAMTNTGKYLKPFFKDLDFVIVLGGARNYIGYYAEFKNIIIDNGLTDKYIAKLPVTDRKRIGHEKNAPLEYLLNRKAVIGFYENFRQDIKARPYAVAYIKIKELGIKYAVEIIYYDKEILKKIKSRMGDNFIYADMDLYLNEYTNNIMPSKSKEEVRSDYSNFKEFYFKYYSDPREKQILDFINK